MEPVQVQARRFPPVPTPGLQLRLEAVLYNGPGSITLYLRHQETGVVWVATSYSWYMYRPGTDGPGTYGPWPPPPRWQGEP